MITIHENGDVLEGLDDKVIASWLDPLMYHVSFLHISREDFARIVDRANRAEQLEAHLVAVCAKAEENHSTAETLAACKAARAFLAGDVKWPINMKTGRQENE